MHRTKHASKLIYHIANDIYLLISQVASEGVISWCVDGLLGDNQVATLQDIFNVIDRLTQRNFTEEDISLLELDTSVALAKLEKYFPVALQVCSYKL